MSSNLHIRYRHSRHGTAHTCTGDLLLSWPEGERPSESIDVFEHLSFEDMMTRVSNALNEYDVDCLFMERLDRPGTKPFKIPNPDVELLRTRPVEAIQAMSPPPIHIDLRNRPAAASPIFIAGHDALANSIGEFLYARVRRGEVECPGCGTWNATQIPNQFHCVRKCHLELPVSFVEGWALFRTQALLDLNLSRYFFPRDWNKTLIFISHEDLSNLYAEWRKKQS